MQAEQTQSGGASNCRHIVSDISQRGIKQQERVRSRRVRVGGEGWE